MTRRARQVLPVSLRPSFWTFVGQKWGDEVDRADHELRAERRRRARVPPRARRVARGARRRVARGSADAAAARGRRRWTGRASSRSRCSPKKQTDGEIFLAPALSSDGTHDRVSVERQLRARPGVHRPVARRRRDGQAHPARSSRSTFDPNFEELRLLYSQSAFSPDGSTLAFTGAAAAARTCSISSTCRSRKRSRRVRSRPRIGDQPELVARRKAARVQRHERRHHRSLSSSTPTARASAQLTDDRYGDLQPQWSPDGKTIAFATRPRQRELRRCCAFSRGRSRCSTSRPARSPFFPDQARAEPQSAVGARRQVDRVRLRSHRNRERLPLRPRRARALSADERRRRGVGAHGVQPGDQLGARRRPAGVHVFRERRVHGLDGRTIRARCGESPYPRAGAADCRRGGGPRRRRRQRRRAPVSVVALLDSFDIGLPDTNRFRVDAVPRALAAGLLRAAERSATRPTRFGRTRVRRHDARDERHARQQPPRDLGRDQRPAERSARVPRLHEPRASLAVLDGALAGAVLLPVGRLARRTRAIPSVARENQQITTYVARQAFAVTAYPLNRFTRIEFGARLQQHRPQPLVRHAQE